MKRRYIVIKEFTHPILGKLFIGKEIPHKDLKHLSREDIIEHIYIQDWNTTQTQYNFGMIFHSTEIDHPQYYCEETREEIKNRLEEEMNQCCCKGNTTFSEVECSECDKCN